VSVVVFVAKCSVLCFSCSCHEALLHTKPNSVVNFGSVFPL